MPTREKQTADISRQLENIQTKLQSLQSAKEGGLDVTGETTVQEAEDFLGQSRTANVAGLTRDSQEQTSPVALLSSDSDEVRDRAQQIQDTIDQQIQVTEDEPDEETTQDIDTTDEDVGVLGSLLGLDGDEIGEAQLTPSQQLLVQQVRSSTDEIDDSMRLLEDMQDAADRRTASLLRSARLEFKDLRKKAEASGRRKLNQLRTLGLRSAGAGGTGAARFVPEVHLSLLSGQTNATMELLSDIAQAETKALADIRVAAEEKNFSIASQLLNVKNELAKSKAEATETLIEELKEQNKEKAAQLREEAISTAVQGLIAQSEESGQPISQQEVVSKLIGAGATFDEAEQAADLLVQEVELPELREFGGTLFERDPVTGALTTLATDPTKQLQVQKLQAEIAKIQAEADAGSEMVVTDGGIPVKQETLERIEELSGTDREQLEDARITVNQFDRLSEIILESPEGTLTMFTEQGREFNRIAEDIADKMARERTGAVVSKDEQDSFKKILGLSRTSRVLSGDQELIDNLNTFKQKHVNVTRLIDPLGDIQAFLDAEDAVVEVADEEELVDAGIAEDDDAEVDNIFS